MKRFLVFAGALLLAFFSANNLAAQDQAVDDLKRIIESRDFIVDAKWAIPMAGNPIVLDSGYNLRVNDDTVTAELPYFGQGRAMGYEFDSSIRFTSLVRDYGEREGRKGAVILVMSAAEMGENFDFQLTFYPNGVVDILLQSDKRQDINYRGVLRK